MKKFSFICSLLCCLGACVERETPVCPAPDEQWIAVGFFRSGEPDHWGQAIDTSFSTIYPLGTRAELSHRRIENFFLLPVPHAGGKVDYIFRQNDLQDTLSLFFVNKPGIDAEECGLFLTVHQLDVLPENTTLHADSIRIGRFFPYEDYKFASKSLAVFVP